MRGPRPEGLLRAIAVPALALVAVAAVLRLAFPHWEAWRAQLASLGPLAPVAYLALWMLLAPCGFPAAALGLLGGALFGSLAGGAWAVAGFVASGLTMYGVGRRWLSPRVARAVAGRPKPAALARAAASGGVRLHVLARLSPLNNAVVSYTLAAGGAPLRPYACGLAGGMPGLLAYVWLGAATGNGDSAPGSATMHRLTLAAGAAGLLLLGITVGRALQREPAPGAGDTDRDH